MSVVESSVWGSKRAPFQDVLEEQFVPPRVDEEVKVSRFLFTAANLITPTIARERPHMRFGGLNVFNPCLNQSKDFIRRGRIVPLLLNQHIPIPAEDAQEGGGYFEVPFVDILVGKDVHNPFGDTGGMVSTFAYPGHQIAYILEGSPNIDGAGQRKGIVEITTLKGHDYKLADVGGFRADQELLKIQAAIFPSYPELPFAIRPFTALVREAIDRNTGVIRAIAEEMLPSCIQWEGWCIRSIEDAHQNMAQAAVKGYSSPYVEMDLLILDQLEMQRQDEHFKRTAQIQSAAQAVDPVALLNAVRQGSAEDRQAFQTMLLEVVKELKNDTVAPVDEQTVKAPVAEKAKAK